jgi:hypothetical protein
VIEASAVKYDDDKPAAKTTRRIKKVSVSLVPADDDNN